MFVEFKSTEDYFQRYDAIPVEEKRPLPECPDYIAIEFSPHEAIGVPFASYNSDVDDDIINVMRDVRDGLFCTDIAEKHDMSKTHAN